MFNRYFSFSLSLEDLSEADLSLLLAAVGDRDVFVERLIRLNEKNLIKAAVLALGANVNSIPVESAVSFGTGLLDLEKELFHQRSNTGVAFVPLDIQAVLMMRSVLRRKPAGERSIALHEIFGATNALYLPMISFETEDERKQTIDPLISEAEAKLLQEVCVQKVRNAKANSEFLLHPWLRYILSYWSKWTSPTEASSWCAAISESDSGLLSLLHPFVEAMNELDGDRSVTVRYRFALEEFARYLKPEDVVQRVRNMASSEEGTNIACRLFTRAFDRSKVSGVSSYPQNLGEWTTLADL